MPALTSEEYTALKAEIARSGIQVPVALDQDGNIIDGHNRVAIANELGIEDYPRQVKIYGTEEERRRDALALNMVRRHLTQQQKRKLIAAEIGRDPHRSDREIGRLLASDHKTVGSVRRELSGEIPRPSKPMTEAERVEAEMYGLYDIDRWIAYGLPDGVDRTTIVGHLNAVYDACVEACGDAEFLDPIRDHIVEPRIAALLDIEPEAEAVQRIGFYRVHPGLAVFPWVDDDMFAAIVDSIRRNGLLNPIILTHDRSTMVDGRIRYRACEAAGVEPHFETLPADYTEHQILARIWSENGVRASYTPDEIAKADAWRADMNGGGA
jgi:ParB-like chromosome segregation protein Spo0J